MSVTLQVNQSNGKINVIQNNQSNVSLIVKAAMRKRVIECKTFRVHNAVVWICGGELIYYNNKKSQNYIFILSIY